MLLQDLRNAVMAAASNDRPLSIGEMLTQFPNIPVNEGNEVGLNCIHSMPRYCFDNSLYFAVTIVCRRGKQHSFWHVVEIAQRRRGGSSDTLQQM